MTSKSTPRPEALTPGSGALGAAVEVALNVAASFVLFGNKFNGASQTVAYGDDYQAATNYPIVRITNKATGHVFYCRTHGHNTMAVGYPGPTYTHLDIPASMETGASYSGSHRQRYCFAEVPHRDRVSKTLAATWMSRSLERGAFFDTVEPNYSMALGTGV